MPVNRRIDLDLPAIVTRLKNGGKLRRDELETVKRRIANAPSDDDALYHLARCLGLGAPPSNENVRLLEPLFSMSTEEWGLHGVIIALCIDWGLTRNYIGKLLEISGPRVWESHQSATISALSALGKYLQDRDDREVAAALLQYLEATSSSEAHLESAGLREYRNSVWHALDEWMRGRQAQIEPTNFDPDSEAFREVMDRSRMLDS